MFQPLLLTYLIVTFNSLAASSDRSKDISSYYIQAHFLSSLFTPDYIIALCNVLAAREQRLFANVSHQEQQQLIESTTSNKTRIEPTGSLVSLTKTTKDDKVTPTQVSDLRSSDTTKAKAEIPVIKSKLESATENQVISESLITQVRKILIVFIIVYKNNKTNKIFIDC